MAAGGLGGPCRGWSWGKQLGRCGGPLTPDSFSDIFLNYYLLIFGALGLRCCPWAFSSCGEQGLLLVAVCGLLTAEPSLVEDRL